MPIAHEPEGSSLDLTLVLGGLTGAIIVLPVNAFTLELWAVFTGGTWPLPGQLVAPADLLPLLATLWTDDPIVASLLSLPALFVLGASVVLASRLNKWWGSPPLLSTGRHSLFLSREAHPERMDNLSILNPFISTFDSLRRVWHDPVGYDPYSGRLLSDYIPGEHFPVATASPETSQNELRRSGSVQLGYDLHHPVIPVLIAAADRPLHFAVLAATGSGKSTLFLEMIRQDLTAPGALPVELNLRDFTSRFNSSMVHPVSPALFVFDPKLDLTPPLYTLAKSLGKRLVVLPEDGFNLLDIGDTIPERVEMAQNCYTIMAKATGENETFFTMQGNEFIHHALPLLELTRGRRVTIAELYHLASDKNERNQLWKESGSCEQLLKRYEAFCRNEPGAGELLSEADKKLAATLKIYEVEAGVSLSAARKEWSRTVNLWNESKWNHIDSLLGQLNGLLSGVEGEYFCRRNAPRVDRALAEGAMVIVRTGGEQGTVEHQRGMLFMALVQLLVKKRENNQIDQPLLCVYVDEALYYLPDNPGFLNMVATARSKNVAIHMATQSIGPIAEEIKTLATNIRNWVFFGGLRDEDAEFVERFIGKRFFEIVGASTNVSQNSREKGVSTGVHRSIQRESLIRAEELMLMRPGHGWFCGVEAGAVRSPQAFLVPRTQLHNDLRETRAGFSLPPTPPLMQLPDDPIADISEHPRRPWADPPDNLMGRYGHRQEPGHRLSQPDYPADDQQETLFTPNTRDRATNVTVPGHDDPAELNLPISILRPRSLRRDWGADQQ